MIDVPMRNTDKDIVTQTEGQSCENRRRDPFRSQKERTQKRTNLLAL
jgi:hypothetical protein